MLNGETVFDRQQEIDDHIQEVITWTAGAAAAITAAVTAQLQLTGVAITQAQEQSLIEGISKSVVAILTKPQIVD